jgi:hypothetical protein
LKYRLHVRGHRYVSPPITDVDLPVFIDDEGRRPRHRRHTPSPFEVDATPGIAEPEASVERGHEVREFGRRHIRRVRPCPPGSVEPGTSSSRSSFGSIHTADVIWLV